MSWGAILPRRLPIPSGWPISQVWLYLVVVLDLYSRMVVGWAMDAHREAILVENAWQMALARRHPEPGLLHHSDRGSQYTRYDYQELLASYGIVVSMSLYLV